LTEKLWRWAARVFGECCRLSAFREGAGLKTLSLSGNEAKSQKDRCPQDNHPLAAYWMELL